SRTMLYFSIFRSTNLPAPAGSYSVSHLCLCLAEAELAVQRSPALVASRPRAKESCASYGLKLPNGRSMPSGIERGRRQCWRDGRDGRLVEGARGDGKMVGRFPEREQWRFPAQFMGTGPIARARCES